MWSLSSRRAWIEIIGGLSPCLRYASRSPHGERGLKWLHRLEVGEERASLSSRRAWIEMCRRWKSGRGPRSLSSRRAWIEILPPGLAG